MTPYERLAQRLIRQEAARAEQREAEIMAIDALPPEQQKAMAAALMSDRTVDLLKRRMAQGWEPIDQILFLKKLTGTRSDPIGLQFQPISEDMIIEARENLREARPTQVSQSPVPMRPRDLIEQRTRATLAASAEKEKADIAAIEALPPEQQQAMAAALVSDRSIEIIDRTRVKGWQPVNQILFLTGLVTPKHEEDDSNPGHEHVLTRTRDPNNVEHEDVLSPYRIRSAREEREREEQTTGGPVRASDRLAERMKNDTAQRTGSIVRPRGPTPGRSM